MAALEVKILFAVKVKVTFLYARSGFFPPFHLAGVVEARCAVFRSIKSVRGVGPSEEDHVAQRHILWQTQVDHRTLGFYEMVLAADVAQEILHMVLPAQLRVVLDDWDVFVVVALACGVVDLWVEGSSVVCDRRVDHGIDELTRRVVLTDPHAVPRPVRCTHRGTVCRCDGVVEDHVCDAQPVCVTRHKCVAHRVVHTGCTVHTHVAAESRHRIDLSGGPFEAQRSVERLNPLKVRAWLETRYPSDRSTLGDRRERNLVPEMFTHLFPQPLAHRRHHRVV